jgi:hypothetical protein
MGKQTGIKSKGAPMNAKLLSGTILALALLGAGVSVCLTGCQSQSGGGAAASTPATNWSNFYGGSSPKTVSISAVCTQTGAPQWCYSVEGFRFDDGGTNFTPLSAPMPGKPGFGFGDYGSFTNIDVSAPACSGTISTPGWSVVAGSHVTFSYSGAAAKSSLVQFCLNCDKTNGNITFKVSDTNGNVTTIGPIAGPQ